MTIVDVNGAHSHYNKWEFVESMKTKKPVTEAQIKAEKQIKCFKPEGCKKPSVLEIRLMSYAVVFYRIQSATF